MDQLITLVSGSMESVSCSRQYSSPSLRWKVKRMFISMTTKARLIMIAIAMEVQAIFIVRAITIGG